MNNNSCKSKKIKLLGYLTQGIIVLMVLQLLPITFAAKDKLKPTLTKLYNSKASKKAGREKNGNVLASSKKAESNSANSSNIATNTSNTLSGINPLLQMPNDLVVVKHGPSINGSRIEGTVRVLLPETTTVNSNASVTGDILVVGTPNVILNGNVTYNGTVVGTGNAQPSGYNVTLNSSVAVRHVVTRTDAITISPVSPPPQPQGTRDVSLNQGQSAGDFNTIRNLTINSNYGTLTVPQGTYGNLVASSNSTFVFGLAGHNTTYNLQSLTLNANSNLQILGAVTINVQSNVSINSQCVAGQAASPISLALNISNGNLTLNSNSTMYGVVRVPSGQVSLNSNALLKGLLVCDRLTANSNSKIQPLANDAIQPVVTITSPTTDQVINTATTVVTGTFQDDSVVTSVKVNNVTATINGNNYTATIPLTVGANTITVTATDAFSNVGTASVNVVRNSTGNQAPVVNAGADQSLTLPTNNLTLNGTVTDDGLPNPPAQVTITWSKISAPSGGTVTFGTPNTAITTAVFNITGTYVLKLEATDSILTISDQMTVVVSQAQQQNQAPSVNAGSDQTTTLPNGVSLNGTVTDDGLPNPPGQLNISWSKASGNGTVTFSNGNNPITAATFSQAGTYILRLSASDSALTTTDDITIIVNPAQPNNAAPQVNAGQDQTVTLPNSVTLQGQASDDGNPNPPGQLTLLWTKVNGNGVVNFTNPNGAITQASVTVAGTYTLRLTASDSSLSSSDDVVVIFNAAANQPPVVNAGNNQIVILPNTVTLTATASDDGLPSSNLTVTWSKASGPGNVSFITGNALTTNVLLEIPGTYVFRITASDGQLSANSETSVEIKVIPRLMVYSTQNGFEPDEITTSGGNKVVSIRNRTNQEVTYVFTQGNQTLSVVSPARSNVFIEVSLEVGTASLTAQGHPGWICSITVVP